jgi:hypothetical protein
MVIVGTADQNANGQQHNTKRQLIAILTNTQKYCKAKKREENGM